MKGYGALLAVMTMLTGGRAFAQAADSTNYLAGKKAIVSLFNNATRDQSLIYYGMRHDGYDRRIEGGAYFQAAEWKPGTLRYKGFTYENVPIRFDEVKQELVVLYRDDASALVLESKYLSQFTIDGHQFYHLPADTVDNVIREGFYDRIYHGKINVFVSRKKIYTSTVVPEVREEFVEETKYYILKDNTWFSSQNKGAMLKVLSDKKNEIKQYMKKHRMGFKSNPELVLAAVASYYETL